MGRKNHLSKIKRLFKLQRLLQDNTSYTPDDLAKIFGVSKRTIFRDLKTLEAMDVKVKFDKKGDGYKIHDRYTLSPAFKTDEAFVMEMALEFLPQNSKEIFAEQIDAIQQKISAIYDMGELKKESGLPNA